MSRSAAPLLPGSIPAAPPPSVPSVRRDQTHWLYTAVIWPIIICTITMGIGSVRKAARQ